MSRRDSFIRRWSDKKQAVQHGQDNPAAVEFVEEAESTARTRTLPSDTEVDDAIDGQAINSSTVDSGECKDDVLVDNTLAGSEIHASVDGSALTDQASSDDAATDSAVQEALEPLLTDEDMPPITTLSATSDLTGFFNRGVSATLRRAALRHVFQLPSYNVRDGLNDYDDDFTYFEPLGDTVTSDMKWHTARKERERLEREKLEEEARLAEEAKAAESEDETTAVEDETDEPQSAKDAKDSTEELTDEPSGEELDGPRDVDSTDADSTKLDTSGEAPLNDIGNDDNPHAEDKINDALLPS